MTPPLPADESTRLAELYSYNILDTLPEDEYDRITELAATLFQVPICLISLVDKDRQWFKSKVGLDVCETSRDISFCQFAILKNDLFIIEDASLDDQFKNNPLVTGAPNIRFYCGAPLTNGEGSAIGTLCLIDDKPRSLSMIEKEQIKTFSDHVYSLLALRREKDRITRERTALKKANDRLDEFTYIASHDLKAPLRGIQTLISFLEEDLQDTIPEESRANLSLLKSRCTRLGTLIDGLLSYSRIGRVESEKEWVDLKEMLPEIIDLLKVSGVEILLPEHLPRLFGNPVRINQVFHNLISNAIKYGCPNGKGQISINHEEDDNAHHFSIEDNGPGIAPEYHEKIFQLFQTLQPRDEIEGTGIGLSLVKKIIEEHSGTISIDADFIDGARFHFSIPKIQPHDI